MANAYQNTATTKLTAHDILAYAHHKLTALAAECGIDWQIANDRLGNYDTCLKKGIALEKKYRGNTSLWFYIKTAKNGQEYPVITFHTLKHGGHTVTFNGWQWLQENRYRFESNTPPPKPAPRPKLKLVPTKAEDDTARFNAFKSIFDTLPRITNTNGYLARKGFEIDDIPANTDIRHGNDKNGHFVAFALKTIKHEIVAYQKLYAEKFTDYNGNQRDKDFIGKTKGAFLVFGNIATDKPLYFAEGLATGLSVFKGIDKGAVIVCLDVHNLYVVKNIFETNNDIKNSIVVIDNDINKNGNAGFFHAIKNKVKNAVYPELDGLKCDFNDVMLAKGISEVTRQLNENKAVFTGNGLNYYLELIKYAPALQLNSIVKKACFVCAKDIINSVHFDNVVTQLDNAINARDLNIVINVAKHLKREYGKRVDAIKKINTVTNFKSLTLHDGDKSKNHELADLILHNLWLNKTSTWLDSRIYGAGKTNLMRFIIGKLFNQLTHDNIKTTYFEMGGNDDGWHKIAANPKLFNQYRNSIRKAYIDYSVIYLCHRVSLTKSASERLGLDYYKDIDHLNETSKKLATCVNSILKFNIEHTDIVFIDEIRQTYEHLLQGTVEKRLQVFDSLIKMIKNAKILLGADADLNDATVQWIKELRPDETINLIQQDIKSNNKTITVKNNHDTLLINAMNDIKAGNNIVICTDSKNTANKAGVYFENYDSDDNIETINTYKNDIITHCSLTENDILVLTSENKGDIRQAEFLANPNAESFKYKVIIHSPVISSGVSIENNHFSAVYGLFHNVLAPNELLQTIARVRNVSNIVVAFKPQNRFIHLREQDLIDAEMESRAKYSNGIKEYIDFDKQRLSFMASRANAQNNIKNDFLVLAQLKGYSVEINNEVEPTKIKGLNKAAKEKRVNSILNTESIDSTQASYIEKITDSTQEQSNSLHKHNALKMTGKTEKELNHDDVSFYLKGGLSIVANHELVNCPDIEKSKNSDRENLITRDKLGSKFGKQAFLYVVINQLIGLGEVDKKTARKVCLGLQDHASELYLNKLGNYYKLKKDSIKQLQGFVEKAGYALVFDRQDKKTGQRLYKLAVNEQVKTYAENRKMLHDLAVTL